MALFGKKKPAENPALQHNPEDDIQIVGGDADETGMEEDSGQVLDFDAIAQDLNAHDDDSTMDAFLGRDSFADANTTADTSHVATNLGDEIDFDTKLDAGAPAVPLTIVATDTNMFGGTPDFGNAPNIEPVVQAPEAPTHAPPMTYTAPILTSELAANGSPVAIKNSLPLPMLLGAAGLLAALGIVGYLVFGGASKPQETAPVAVAVNPPLQATANTPGVTSPGSLAPNSVAPSGAVPAPGGPSGAVNQGIAVDGVPIAPGVVIRQAPIGSSARNTALGTAPATAMGETSANLTPALKAQLKALWSKGADAKHSGNFAGARAAWTQMLKLRPNNTDVQAAIDKLPPA